MKSYNILCEEILQSDPKIRFVGVFDKEHNLHSKMRKDTKGLLNQEETDKSMRLAYIRWQSRKSLSSKTGRPIYAMALYEKVMRFTFTLNSETLLLVSTEVDVSQERIINNILKQKDNFQSIT